MVSDNPLAQLGLLVVSTFFALWLFYGDSPTGSNDMNFYIIMDIDKNITNGVVLESEEGILGTRLAGDKGTDDPHRILPELLGRMPAQGFPLETGKSSDRKVVRYRPGQPNFASAWLKQLRPPLAIGARGLVPQVRIDRAKTPEKITRDLWKLFDGTAEEIPKYKVLKPSG